VYGGVYPSSTFFIYMEKEKINPSLAVGVVIKNKDNKILLVQEGRNKYYERAKGAWGLPTGRIEWTEPIEEGLRREIKEELNVEANPIGLIGVYQYCRDDSQCFGLAFVVELVGNEEDIKYNTKELQAIKWLDIEQALRPDIRLRYGAKEVLEDYKNNFILPFKYIHFFDLRNRKLRET